MNYFDKDLITLDGRTFEVKKFSDYDHGAPWDNEDGHGPMREVRSRDDKKPGERLILSNRGNRWAYDWQAAIATAKADGWGLDEDELAALTRKLGRTPTKGEIVAQSVESDYQRMRGWILDHWSYIGVSVRIVGPDGEPQGEDYTHACWGIESDGDYWRDVARELAGEILHTRRDAWRKALKEARAARYWAMRGVETK